MKMYRASDLDETCQRVLMQHAPQSRPEHVMGSLFDRIEPKDVEKLKKLVSKGVTRYHAKRSLGGVAPEEKKRMGKRLFKQAMLCVRKARFKKTVPCKSCGKQCKPHPSVKELRGCRYLLAAGTTCISWSALGCSAGWLHSSLVPFAIWLEDVRRQMPTHVIHECTRAFDFNTLNEFLSPWYGLEQMVCSPVDFGVPVKRNRSYILMSLKSAVVIDVPFARTSMQDLEIFQQVVGCARMFFRAPGSAVARFIKDNIRPERLELEESDARCTLTQAAASRLEEHLVSQVISGASFACIAYNQRLEFMAFDDKVPALTRSSTLWGATLPPGTAVEGSVIDRPMIPIELVGVQGWPVLLAAAALATAVLGSRLC